MALVCDCRFGYPESLRKYYKTSGNQTRESLNAEQDWHMSHNYCGDLSWRTIEAIITKASK
jgi:hypothetical protein